MENKNSQMSLLEFGGIGEAINRVFGNKEVKNAKGNSVGVRVALQPKKMIAEALDLKGRNNAEELQAAILKASDAAMRQVKGEIATLGQEWTLKSSTSRKLGNGVRQVSIVIQEIKRPKAGPTDEQVAEIYGITVEQAKTMRETQEAKKRGIEVDSEVTDEPKRIEAGK